MKIRKDGEVTRESILKAASLVFGEKGYHKATHAEIAQTAGVNTALINFHFGSKDELYRAVWERIDAEMEHAYPMDGGVSADAPASERLRAVISCLISRTLDPRLQGFQRIFATELVNPTGLLDKIITQRRQEHRSHLRKIIGELLGPGADDHTINLCEASIVGQCRFVAPHHSRRRCERYKYTDVAALTEHITTFSLAGIEATRRKMEAAR